MTTKPKLYYTPGNPGGRTVLMVAKELNLELELILLNMAEGEHLKPEFLKINPQHTVPTLVDGDKPMWDSHAIATYLIGKYGGGDHPLYPKDLYTRARIDQRLQFDTGVIFEALRDVMLPIYFEGAYEVSEKAIKSSNQGYAFLEKFLSTESYLVGDKLTVADLSVVTTMTNLTSLVAIDSEKYPKLQDWMKRMAALPYFKELNSDKYNGFFKFILDVIARNKAAAGK